MADNALTRLPVAGQLAVSIGAGLAIGAAFYFLFYQAKVEEKDQKQTQLDALQKTIRELEITVAKLPEFEKEVRALEEKLEVLKRFLPAERETPDLMRKVHSLATGASLTIMKFDASPQVSKDFYIEYPYQVEVNGTYHNLGVFFDRMGRLPRLVNASQINITAQATQRAAQTINAKFTATTYVYQEKPAQPARPGGGPPR
jgi:type IV pilus assembly protein PilO